MFKIYDGRESFYQWDIDRKLIINSNDIKEVHFCNCTNSESIVCETYEQDGQLLVDVPNVLLQEAWNINVYAYEGDDHTATSKLFIVIPRTKPADYVYTEEELKTWEGLDKRITTLEENGADVDLSDYYTKKETEKLISEIDIPEAAPEIHVGEKAPTGKELIWINPNGDDLTEFATKEDIPTIPTNVSAFVNDAGYLTEHQDLSGYALKTEIPDVSSFTTMAAVEGKGYQTAEQVSALIASALGEVENGAY